MHIKQVLKDIQTLNAEAIAGTYEVSAISFAAYPQVCKQYYLMPCGASIGYKYGPVLVTRADKLKSNIKDLTIAIPGQLTTAYLVLQLFEPNLKVIVAPFDQIIELVQNGKVDAGLVIHEGQLTYQSDGLVKIVDLGQWWFEKTQLPLPLGGNIIRKDLGEALILKLAKLLRDSISYSLSHRAEALDYALTYARGLDKDLADRFVGMYVNEFTVDYGDLGKKAIETLFNMAHEKGIFAEKIVPEFVDLALTR